MTAAAVEPPKTWRGTTNANVRGNTVDRRHRREWLVETFRADVDGVTLRIGHNRYRVLSVPRGKGEHACRCYRCGTLLTVANVSPDRIIPGCRGGRYTRDNIRPACVTCQSITGGQLGAEQKRLRATGGAS